MFAWCIRRLTLFAFIAHAVMGCCWHHAHGAGHNCCLAGDAAAETSQSEVAVCPAETSSCDCHSAVKSAGDAVQLASYGHPSAAGYDAPDDGAHPCDESRCRYVNTKSHSFERAHKVGLGTWFVSAKPQVLHSLSPLAAGRSLQLRIGWQFPDAGEQCAYLQSWQL